MVRTLNSFGYDCFLWKLYRCTFYSVFGIGTFGAYHPHLANTNDVSKATRSDLNVTSLSRPVGPSLWRISGDFRSPTALHQVQPHSQGHYISKYIFISYVFYFSFVILLTFSAPAIMMCDNKPNCGFSIPHPVIPVASLTLQSITGPGMSI
jgi:hypothetical protein